MTREEDRPSFFSKTIEGEATPIDHVDHPDLTLMFSSLEGDLAPDVRSALAAHLATCTTCHARYRELERRLQDAAEAHDARARVPSFDAYVHEQSGTRTTMSEWIRSLLEPRPYVLVAASAAALALVLAVAIPLVRGPSLRTSGQIELLNNRISDLQSQLISLADLNHGIPNQSSVGNALVVSDLTRLDWERPAPYAVQPGDNWEGIAERELGDADLWPLVWLLNRDIGTPDVAPPVGATLELPTPRSSP